MTVHGVGVSGRWVWRDVCGSLAGGGGVVRARDRVRCGCFGARVRRAPDLAGVRVALRRIGRPVSRSPRGRDAPGHGTVLPRRTRRLARRRAPRRPPDPQLAVDVGEPSGGGHIPPERGVCRTGSGGWHLVRTGRAHTSIRPSAGGMTGGCVTCGADTLNATTAPRRSVRAARDPSAGRDGVVRLVRPRAGRRPRGRRCRRAQPRPDTRPSRPRRPRRRRPHPRRARLRRPRGPTR